MFQKITQAVPHVSFYMEGKGSQDAQEVSRGQFINGNDGITVQFPRPLVHLRNKKKARAIPDR